MTLACTCPHCQSILHAPAAYLGRTVKCAGCQLEFEAEPGTPEISPAIQAAQDDAKSCLKLLAIPFGLLVAFVLFVLWIGLFGEKKSEAELKAESDKRYMDRLDRKIQSEREHQAIETRRAIDKAIRERETRP